MELHYGLRKLTESFCRSKGNTVNNIDLRIEKRVYAIENQPFEHGNLR